MMAASLKVRWLDLDIMPLNIERGLPTGNGRSLPAILG